MNLCSFGVHKWVTKASWTRCVRCWKKPPKPARLAPKRRRNLEGWRRGPIR